MFDFLSTTSLLTFLLVLIIYVYLKYHVYDYWDKHGVPHETPSIPFGNVTMSFFLATDSLGNVIKDSYEKFKQYPFHGFYIFNRPVLIINEPDLIKSVMVTDFSKFCDRGWYMDEKLDPLSAHIFLQRGDKWRFLRNKFTPAFTPNKLKQIHPLMVEISNEMIKTCDAELERTNMLEVKDILTRYTTDIISSVVYGFNCNSLNDAQNKFLRMTERGITFGRFNMLLAAFLPEVLEKVALAFYPMEVRNFFEKIFCDTVNYRRREKIERKDFMNLLIQLMEHGQLKDEKTLTNVDNIKGDDKVITLTDAASQAFLFILAGFETTSSTATYCLLELAMNTEIQKKLQQEIDEAAERTSNFTYEAIMEMEYLEMVFSETLRKYSAAAFLNRICIEDYPIPNSNYVIPKGMRIIISPPGLHHNPDFFPNPDEFDPNRFTKENIASRDTAVHLEFGAGPRNCIGKIFGILETKQALIAMLYNYNFRISDKTKLPVKFVTESFVQTPDSGVYLHVEKRKR